MRILIFLLISFNSFGQINPKKIKIESGFYHGSKCKVRECHADEFTSEDSTASDEDSGNAYSEIINITYPIITTTNSKVNKFIKDTVGGFIKLEGQIPYQKCSSSQNWNCILDMPDRTEINYNVTYVNKNFLSLIISEDWDACCGASGSYHNQTPFTFDLANKKLLILKDIIKKDRDSTLYTIAIKQLIIDLPQFFPENADINNLDLINFKSLLDYPFATSKDKITIYLRIDAGGRSFDTPVDIYFENNTELFYRSFLTKIKTRS